jgi:hypothetical protein
MKSDNIFYFYVVFCCLHVTTEIKFRNLFLLLTRYFPHEYFSHIFSLFFPFNEKWNELKKRMKSKISHKLNFIPIEYGNNQKFIFFRTFLPVKNNLLSLINSQKSHTLHSNIDELFGVMFLKFDFFFAKNNAFVVNIFMSAVNFNMCERSWSFFLLFKFNMKNCDIIFRLFFHFSHLPYNTHFCWFS